MPYSAAIHICVLSYCQSTEYCTLCPYNRGLFAHPCLFGCHSISSLSDALCNQCQVTDANFQSGCNSEAVYVGFRSVLSIRLLLLVDMLFLSFTSTMHV